MGHGCLGLLVARVSSFEGHADLINLQIYIIVIEQQLWSSGMMLACHAGDPGSIPGSCILVS